ncbi:MAG TPA: isoprenylcysteine carboxylmethyltransferase family protein [Povalibacter sp.]|nr:isoprenylcysteine carboxylmethyltransferase family protein [Povalibacter sp.]
MFLRALLAFLALPGMVAFVIPGLWLWRGGHTQLVHPWGLVLLGSGIVLLLWCVRDFYVAGKGTLAPWSPPQRLVVVGLYRYSRNPMYISVALVLLGWAITFGSSGLATYALIVVIAFHLRVVFGEEPWLARTHGQQWSDYTARVRRWL